VRGTPLSRSPCDGLCPEGPTSECFIIFKSWRGDFSTTRSGTYLDHPTSTMSTVCPAEVVSMQVAMLAFIVRHLDAV
jgi:hypothetical protein